MDTEYQGEVISNKYNVRFLEEAVSRIENDILIMSMPEKNSKNPTKLQGYGEDGYVNLIMPIAEDIEE